MILTSPFTCDGAAVCVGSKPVKSFGVGSQGQCVLECKRQQRQGPEPNCSADAKNTLAQLSLLCLLYLFRMYL